METAAYVARMLLALLDGMNDGKGFFKAVQTGPGIQEISRTGHRGTLEVVQVGENTRIRWLGQRGRPHLVKPGQTVLNAHKWFGGFQPNEIDLGEVVDTSVPNWTVIDTSVEDSPTEIALLTEADMVPDSQGGFVGQEWVAVPCENVYAFVA